MSMNYLEDAKVLRRGPVLDPNLRFAVAAATIPVIVGGLVLLAGARRVSARTALAQSGATL